MSFNWTSFHASARSFIGFESTALIKASQNCFGELQYKLLCPILKTPPKQTAHNPTETFTILLSFQTAAERLVKEWLNALNLTALENNLLLNQKVHGHSSLQEGKD